MERLTIYSSWATTRGDADTPARAEAQARADLQAEITAQYDLQREPVFRYLVAIGVNATEAEDILQDAFLKAYECLADRTERCHNLRAWIFRVAHNLAINHLKRRRRMRYGLDLTDAAVLSQQSSAPSPEQAVLEQEDIKRTRAAMAKLTPQELQCLQLRAEGLRYREIAEIVGTGISSVAEAVARGCRKLTD